MGRPVGPGFGSDDLAAQTGGAARWVAPPVRPAPAASPLWPRVLALLLLGGLSAAALWLHEARGAAASFSLITGALLGIVFQRSRFCFHCILRDLFDGTDARPLVAILTALAVGSAGYAVIFSAWLADPAIGRLPPDAHIGPVSWALVLAGLAFGLGMALSGSCISGHLYRLGEGSLRAPFALVGTIAGFGLGFMTWDRLYLLTIADAPVAWLPRGLGYAGALALQLAVLAALSLALLPRMRPRPPLPGGAPTLAGLADALLRERWHPAAGGAAVGVIAIAAYFRTEPLGVTAQLGSIARTAGDALGLLPGRLLGLDGFAGCATAVVHAVTDNGLLVLALVAGSLAAALAGGHFRPVREPPQRYATALLGGIAMGWGAMTALGCTIGTLLSGIMAFALSGWVFALAVGAGVWAGLAAGRRFG